MKKIITTFLGLFLLTGCSDSLKGYFKRSPANKLMDGKGFRKEKRAPLYNKKYISLAKRNVLEGDFDSDEEEELISESDTETINPTLRNRKMYLRMIEQDLRSKAERKIDTYNYNNKPQGSCSLITAKNKVAQQEDNSASLKLQQELTQIKAMLYETRKELAKYSCPCPPEKLDSYIDDEMILPSKLSDNNRNLNSGKLKQKFLHNECDDEPAVSKVGDTINSSDDAVIKRNAIERVNNNIIDDYEKSETTVREI